jgi:CRP-like cAMP-binding protein
MRRVLFIFSHLRDEDVRWLANAGQVEPLEEQHLLIQEGTQITKLYFLLEGEIKIFAKRAPEETITVLKSGDIIGEMSFIDAAPTSASAMTISECEVLSLSKRLVEEKLKTDTGFAARFYRAIAMFLSDRLRASNPNHSNEALDEEELDENFLDTVSEAGQRFTDMLQMLKGN